MRVHGCGRARQANSVLLEDKYKNSTVKFVLGGEFARPEEPEVGTCFPKLYETRYLAGMVAGNATRSNVIGYVVSFFIPQTLRQANAFARGVREVGLKSGRTPRLVCFLAAVDPRGPAVSGVAREA